jgi:hypothetical protein
MTLGRVDATVRFPAVTNVSMRINVRWDPNTGNGYRLIMPTDYDGFQLVRVDAYTETPLHEEFTLNWAVNTNYRVAFEFFGQTLRAKRWAVGDAEPGTWNLSTTDSAYTSGDVALVTVVSGSGGTVHGLWDDVTINDAVNTAVSIGQATETDTAGTVTPAKSLAIPQVAEADTAGTTSPAKSLAINQAAETDTADAVTASGHSVPVPQATEADTAGAVTPAKAVPIGQTTETSTANSISSGLTVSVAIGLATEDCLALPVAPSRPGGGCLRIRRRFTRQLVRT